MTSTTKFVLQYEDGKYHKGKWDRTENLLEAKLWNTKNGPAQIARHTRQICKTVEVEVTINVK